MPDQDFSRVCPQCGRRVPRNVVTCRCGLELPLDDVTPYPEAEAEAETAAEAPSSNATPIIAIVLTVIALAGAGYWMFMRPAPADVAAGTDAEDEEADADATEAENTAADAAANTSAAARAWDAAANANDVPPAAAAAAPAGRASAPDPGLSSSLEEMVDRVMPAVVLIETSSGRGSGFFVRYDTLITNVHVVQNDSYVTLRLNDGSTLNARVESRAPEVDIAVLKVSTPSQSQAVIPMGTAQSLRPGQEIIVIGSALGTLQNSVSRGIMSGLRTSGGATLVQTDAATNPGNSGGPMLDRNGAVIGITTMGYRGAEGLNFGVAIDHARDLLEGRQVNLGSQRGLADIQSQSRGSETDRRQQQGEQLFRRAMDQLSAAAGSLDGGWRRFRQTCYTNPIPGNYEREWFVMFVPRGLPSNAATGCMVYFTEMQGEMNQFRDLMRRALDEARRSNVLPGTVRDALRSNRLDFEW